MAGKDATAPDANVPTTRTVRALASVTLAMTGWPPLAFRVVSFGAPSVVTAPVVRAMGTASTQMAIFLIYTVVAARRTTYDLKIVVSTTTTTNSSDFFRNHVLRLRRWNHTLLIAN